MATSQVQIAKMALAHFGDRFDISSITEASTEAEQVNLVYENAVRSVLRRFDWNFARAWTSPSYLTTPVDAAGDIDVPGLWSYMFTYPTDAVRILKIVNPLGDRADPLRWEVGLNGNGVKVIMCNEETPEINYTKYLSDPNYFDDMFVMALSYYIASLCALALTGDGNVAQAMLQQYERVLAMAASQNMTEGVEEVHPEAEWIKARA